MKIGVFDSGVGGLTVVREIIRESPTADIIYMGDSLHVPYGTKTKEQLRDYIENIISFLEEEKVDVIVFACNTATSLLLEEMRIKYATPMIGMIEAGADMAMRIAQSGIGVIATTNTVNSGAYERAFEEKGNRLPVCSWACDPLVQVVETYMRSGIVNESLVQKTVGEWPIEKGDTLVLGCTHFPLIHSVIGQHVGTHVNLINPAIEVAKRLKERDVQQKGYGRFQCFTSGDARMFQQQATAVFGKEIAVETFIHKKKASEI